MLSVKLIFVFQRNNVSHSLYANMQQLVASLKYQHPSLHRLGLAMIADQIPIDRIIERFRDVVQKEIDRYRNRLPILIKFVLI